LFSFIGYLYAIQVGKFRPEYSNDLKLACLTPGFPVSAGRREGDAGLETKEGVPGVHCITSFILSRLTIERRCGPERIVSIPPTAIGPGWSFILM